MMANKLVDGGSPMVIEDDCAACRHPASRSRCDLDWTKSLGFRVSGGVIGYETWGCSGVHGDGSLETSNSDGY